MGSKKGNIYLATALNNRERPVIVGIYPTVKQATDRLEELCWEDSAEDWHYLNVHVITTPEYGTDLEIAL